MWWAIFSRGGFRADSELLYLALFSVCGIRPVPSRTGGWVGVAPAPEAEPRVVANPVNMEERAGARANVGGR
jgi:hypothetical protein